MLRVIYLIFTEGYAATGGAALVRAELVDEAVRLARILHRLLPGEREVAGLLALMLLVDARRAARVDARGDLVLLDDQDRSLWDRAKIKEGRRLVVAALTGGPPGPYALQAAIAAVHDEAATVATTDWPQVVALYDVLRTVAPSPLVELNRAVAVAMVDGPAGRARRCSTRWPSTGGWPATTCCPPPAPTCCAGSAGATRRADAYRARARPGRQRAGAGVPAPPPRRAAMIAPWPRRAGRR